MTSYALAPTYSYPKITVTTTAGTLQLENGYAATLRVVAPSTNATPVWVAIGTTAEIPASERKRSTIPILPGQTEMLTIPQGATSLSYIVATGTGELYVTIGNGGW